ncbi:Helicase associated domain protein [Mycolicibacterium sp. 22603]|uniref:Helicase associated domain protein n=1 Tax=Mycolicibacterium sp. 22603 TaxID=3453950 RepID=UPI003F86DF59
MGTFSDLRAQFDPDDNRRRGKQFEYVCKWFLENHPTYQPLLRRVWLWDDWPGRKGIDAGIDLVAEGTDGKLWAIQSKAYATSHSISKRDVDKFISESSRSKFAHRLLIATTDKRHPIATRLMDDLGIPFVGLTQLREADDYLDWPSTPAALRASKPPKPKRPWEYQKAAISDVVKSFRTADRGQLIMACGTGKTLTAWFITEKLAAERTLVLVPSLSLLKQTMREWQTANPTKPFATLPVCSDETVGSLLEDAAVSHTSDLGVPVTTDPIVIAEFLRKRSGPRVVFSTYQSSPQIAAAFALGRVPQFDLVIADEAHRVAGPVSRDFGTVLDAAAIRGKRRLFMTATPRYFTGRVLREAKDADYEIASMDDPARFGKVFHRLSFSEAIDRKLLTDYQVAILGVDDATYRAWAERGALVTLDGKKITDARLLAGQIGLAKAMKKFDLRRTISFHSRVKTAREFAASMPTVLDWMPPRQRPNGWLWSNYASGEMSAGERGVLIQQLKRLDDGERGLLANARCLAEGVDVPALDGVAFIDPRRSEVDIVQAVGRAIRKSDNKKIGTVVIPVFIDSEEDPEVALDSSAFKPVWDVIKALRAHDTELGEELDALRREMGRKGGKPRLPNKIHVDVPATVSKSFANAFEVRLVDATTAPWQFWYGLLEKYVAEHGTSRLTPGEVFDGFKLGRWVANQRTRRAGLSQDRRSLLEALPEWSWTPHTERWEMSFQALADYVTNAGTADVPAKLVINGINLGGWAKTQRALYIEGSLNPVRAERLSALPGWRWDRDLIAEAWERGFRHLLCYVRDHGTAAVPGSETIDGFPLGTWASQQRNNYQRGRLSPALAARLAALPEWTWGVRETRWESGFQRLLAYIAKHGDGMVPAQYVIDGYRLGSWVNSQRTRYMEGSLEQHRVQRLEEVPGWTWDARDETWEDGFLRLGNYVAAQGNSRVPTSFVDDEFKLGQWVSVQRVTFAKGSQPEDRKIKLEALPGWSWDVKTDLWEEGFRRLQDYVGHHGTLPAQAYSDTDDYRLGSWVTTQRQNFAQGRLELDRVRRLEAIPCWSWNSRDTRWEEGFRRLKNYADQYGIAQVSQAYEDADGYRLGSWITTQRVAYDRGTLSADRQQRLEMLPGWSWDPLADAWEARYAQLADYVARYGTSRVPQSSDDDESVLGRWVQNQRNNFAAGKLSREQINRLEVLPDWRWSRFKAGVRSKRLNDDEKRQFRRRVASGEPILELAAEFGIGRTTAYRLVESDS